MVHRNKRASWSNSWRRSSVTLLALLRVFWQVGQRDQRASFLACAILSLALSACSYGTFFVPKQTKVYAPTDIGSIAISTQHDLTVPYERLGRVAVTAWGDGESVRSMLQDQASKLGANAIIAFRVERSFGRSAASGLAVRVFTKQAQ